MAGQSDLGRNATNADAISTTLLSMQAEMDKFRTDRDSTKDELMALRRTFDRAIAEVNIFRNHIMKTQREMGRHFQGLLDEQLFDFHEGQKSNMRLRRRVSNLELKVQTLESRISTSTSTSSLPRSPKPLRRQGAFYDEDIEDLPWDRLNNVSGPEKGALPDSWANGHKAQGTQTRNPNDVSTSRKRSRDTDEDGEDVQGSAEEGTHPSPPKRRRTVNESSSASSSQAFPAGTCRPITRTHRRPQESILTTILVPLLSGAFAF